MFEIVTDSGANLTAKQARTWGVTVLPMSADAGEAAKTLKMIAEKKDALCICLSSALSGFYDSIRKGAEGNSTKHRVVVFDSLCGCCGEGMLVQLAARERQKGAGMEKVLQILRQSAVQVCHLFLVDHGVESVVLMLDLQGKSVPCHRTTDRKTALRYMAKMYRRTVQDGTRKICIAHRNCLADAAYLAGQIGTDTAIAEINDSFTMYTGENTVALFYPGTLRVNPLI